MAARRIMEEVGVEYGIRGDGEQAVVELYRQLTGGRSFEEVPGLLWREELFSVQDLPSGLHHIRVTVSADQNANSLGNWTILDAFDVTH